MQTKKVKFTEDVKKYDGSIILENDIIFYRIITSYFDIPFLKYDKIKIVDLYDILSFLENDEKGEDRIDYCTQYLKNIIDLLIIKSKEEYQKNWDEIVNNDFGFDIIYNEDPYWDTPFFENIAKKQCNRYKVPLISKGSRDFNVSFSTRHIKSLKKLLIIFKDAKKELINIFLNT